MILNVFMSNHLHIFFHFEITTFISLGNPALFLILFTVLAFDLEAALQFK